MDSDGAGSQRDAERDFHPPYRRHSLALIMLIGLRASCALKIMSAQDARGPMSMTRCYFGPAQPSRASHLALRCSSRDFLKSWPNGALSKLP